MPETLPVILPDWPAPVCVKALQTTREGGVSQFPYAALNLALHTGDNPEAVRENRARLVTHLPTHLPAEPVWLEQVHGSNAILLTGKHFAQPPRADAAISHQKNQVCAIMTADCLPILLCDREGSMVAAIHAGWRGLAAGVVENTLRAAQIAPERILAWLGPAIGATAFEVGEEVRTAFCANSPEAATAFIPVAAPENSPENQGSKAENSSNKYRADKYYADIYTLARQRLNAAGVSGITQVFGGDCCAFSEPERFFSYRRDGVTGRMASLIWLE